MTDDIAISSRFERRHDVRSSLSYPAPLHTLPIPRPADNWPVSSGMIGRIQPESVAAFPRNRRPDSPGICKQVRVSWAEEKSKFTALFERLAIMVLQETNIAGAGKILRISWDEAWHIVERAVRRGQERKKPGVVKKMGVDEKSLGNGHNYLTLIYDLKRSTVEQIENDRKKESLGGYFRRMKPAQRTKIEAIATDIWDPYLASIREHVPGYEEKLVFDRYHLMTHMVKAVDRVRKQEHRDLRGEGNEILSGTKYLWLYSRENLPAKKRRAFLILRRMRLRTARAWAIKEELRRFWSYQTEPWARKHFSSWYGCAIRSQLNPVEAVARMFRKYLPNIMIYLRHRITNTVSEGVNSMIQTIKKMACGFRNREHFKLAIFLPLWRSKPLPCYPQECRMSQKRC